MPITIPDPTTPMTLVVTWTTGANVHGRRLMIGGEVAEDLREFARQAAATTELEGGRTYDPDESQDDTPYFVADHEEAWDVALLDTIRHGDGLPEANGDDLKRAFTCYALVVGDSESPTLYIRKANPVALARKPLIAGLVDNTIKKITSPLFSFDSKFDVIVTPEQIYAIDKSNFERLFKETEAVLARAGEWVDALIGDLPITGASRDTLIEIARRNSFHRKKIQSIGRRAYVQKLTPALLRTKMQDHGLDADTLMPNGELDFAEANVRDLLRLLNEDLFRGDFSDEQFAASSKQLARG